MRTTLLTALGVTAGFIAAPAQTLAAPALTIAPDCANPETQWRPYKFVVVFSGLPAGALLEVRITYSGESLGPAFVRVDENGEFRFHGGATGPGVVTASGFHDIDEDHTQDPGEPRFQASITHPCADPPVPGGSVSGAADITLENMFGLTPVRLSVDARSGPTGQNPLGTVRLGTPTGDVDGTVTCVSVKGLLGTIGVRLNPPLPGGVSAALIGIADISADPGNDHDLVNLEPVPIAPSQCPFPSIGFGSTTANGTFVVTAAPTSPTLKDQCRNGGWRSFGVFKNHGDCVSFVATKGKNPPADP